MSDISIEPSDRLSKALKFCRNRKNGGTLYLIKSGQFYKIGITNNLNNRLQQYRLHNPHEIRVIAHRDIATRKRLEAVERSALNRFSRFNHSGEWFCLSDDKLEELISRYYTVKPSFRQQSASSINHNQTFDSSFLSKTSNINNL